MRAARSTCACREAMPGCRASAPGRASGCRPPPSTPRSARPSAESSRLAEQRDDLIGGLRDRDARGAERFFLALCRAPVAGDDRARMAHPLALGRGAPRDEGHRLEAAAPADQLCRALLV